MFPNSIATVCYDFGDFYRSTCEPRIRAGGGSWQTSPCYRRPQLARNRTINPINPTSTPADFINFRSGEEGNLCVGPWGDDSAKQAFAAPAAEPEFQAAYCLKTTGGPLSRFPLRLTVTSTRSAILTKGMPLFIP